jgi:predicted DNA-binding ribbon-helix-helix protein
MQGMITSIRLKFSFWEILADLAAIEVCATRFHTLNFPEA